MVAVEVYRYTFRKLCLRIRICGGLAAFSVMLRIWSAPQQHIRDFFVKTDLDDQYRNANVEVSAKLKIMGPNL